MLDVVLKIATLTEMAAEHCQKQYLDCSTSLGTAFGGEKTQIESLNICASSSTVSSVGWVGRGGFGMG